MSFSEHLIPLNKTNSKQVYQSGSLTVFSFCYQTLIILLFFDFFSRGREDRVHPDAPGGLRRYLVQGDRVLRYSLLWNDERCGGGPQLLCLNIYLKDNTMEMLYPSGTNAGRGERNFLFF